VISFDAAEKTAPIEKLPGSMAKSKIRNCFASASVFHELIRE
jgi:hypothetical protein